MGNALIAAMVFGNIGAISSVAGPIGWGLALMVAISVTGGVSGMVLNFSFPDNFSLKDNFFFFPPNLQ